MEQSRSICRFKPDMNLQQVLLLLILFYLGSKYSYTEGANSHHHLLLLCQGSGQTSEELWAYTGGYNDDGLKHEGHVTEIYPGGNFRAAIEDSWGTPVFMSLRSFSERGYIMAEMWFDVNADDDVNNATVWLTSDRLLVIWPQNPKYRNIALREGNNEVLVTSNSNTSAYFSIVHNTSDADPLIVLAKNTTTYMTIDNTGDIENLTTIGDPELILASVKTDLHKDTNITIPDALDWVDDFVYISTISVHALTSTDQTTIFWFKLTANIDTSLETYADKIGDPPLTFPTDGTLITMDTLLVQKIQIIFLTSVTDSTVKLFGPPGNFVAVSYIVLTGIFEQVDSTSTSSTSTTPSEVTNISLTTVFDTTSISTISGNATTPSPANNSSATTLAPDTSTVTDNSTSSQASINVTSTTSAIRSVTTVSTAPTSVQATIDSTSASNPYSTCSGTYVSAILINGSQYCPCLAKQTNGTLEFDIDKVIQELTLNAKQLSSYTSKFTSAEDNRPSAQTLGSLGLIIIIGVVVTIIVLDSHNLSREFKKIRKNYKYIKRRISQRSLKVQILENNETQSMGKISPQKSQSTASNTTLTSLISLETQT